MATYKLASSLFVPSGIPVFMYHDISDDHASRERYTISASLLRKQLLFLKQREFVVVGLSEISQNCNQPSVVLTFDDGLDSHYKQAFPLLGKLGFTATFFVSTGLLGAPGYLSWNQLRQMSDAGMTIGSHGHRHINYSSMCAEMAEGELRRSRLILENGLGKSVTTFAAPFGLLSRRLAQSLRRAGFECVCSSHPWLASGTASVISRLAVYNETAVRDFSALAQRNIFPLLRRRIRNAILHLPKHVLLFISPERLGVQVCEEVK